MPGQEELNHLGVGLSLLLRNGVRVYIERGTAVRMPQQILRDFDIRSECSKQRSKGVAKVVAADDLSAGFSDCCRVH